MKVKVLSDHVANLIAAGEVVERPSSVIRELVDNALDAGARTISVVLEQGGHSLIRVTDDGCGMERDDAMLAFERHATSKLSTPEELNSISSLGFRGEALPSIASVSKVVLRTKVAGAAHGTEIELRGGKLLEVRACACNPGSDFEVRALFFNTPARRKFLKSPRSEVSKIKQWLLQMALGHCAVHFRLSVDGEEVLNLPPKSDALARARSVLRGTSVPFEKNIGPHRVSGLLGHPSMAEGELSSFAVLVNRRLVSDRLILRAVKESFGSALKDREFPVGFLLLEIPPEEVDVNVHPQKSEVRFRYPQAVFHLVYGAIVDAIKEFRSPLSFSATAATPQESRSTGWNTPLNESPSGGARSSFYAATQQQPLGFFGTEQPTRTEDSRREEPFRYSSLRYLAQLFECYLLCELEGRFYVVDMHAAHERWNYNRIRQSLRDRSRSRELGSQNLLLPEIVQVGEEGAIRLEEHQPLLEGLGFEFVIDQTGSIEIRAVPAILLKGDYRSALHEVSRLSSEEGGGTHAFEYQIDQIAARLACHASVRSGKALSSEEAYSLFTLLDSSECSSACPHGRPVIVSFSEKEVEQWFGRDR